MRTTDKRKTYKPIQFPWALEAMEKQHKMHWLATEISMYNDLYDFNNKLTTYEQEILTQILRFFTQSDVEVARAYVEYYLPIFNCPEIRMMLLSFASMETIHVEAYSYLLTSLRLPDQIYSEFLKYQEMVNKYDYMQSFNIDDPKSVALTLAIFSGGVEGLSLFSSFAMLMYFSTKRPKERLLIGLGSIVSFSIRDESLHSSSVIRLFKEYCKENLTAEERNQVLKNVRDNFLILVSHEFAFIDLVMNKGDLPDFTKEDLKGFIKYLCDLRLQQLGAEPIFNSTTNPLPWMEQFMSSIDMSNFLETGGSTSYQKGIGVSEDNAFSDFDIA